MITSDESPQNKNVMYNDLSHGLMIQSDQHFIIEGKKGYFSGYDRSNLKVKALEPGTDDYIPRSFMNAELLSGMRAVMRRARRCRSNLFKRKAPILKPGGKKKEIDQG
jgi:hypothetical protein